MVAKLWRCIGPLIGAAQGNAGQNVRVICRQIPAPEIDLLHVGLCRAAHARFAGAEVAAVVLVDCDFALLDIWLAEELPLGFAQVFNCSLRNAVSAHIEEPADSTSCGDFFCDGLNILIASAVKRRQIYDREGGR